MSDPPTVILKSWLTHDVIGCVLLGGDELSEPAVLTAAVCTDLRSKHKLHFLPLMCHYSTVQEGRGLAKGRYKSINELK